MLGVFPNEAYREHVVQIHPDDTLLLYSDGATEAMNFAGETFNRARLAESFLRYADLPVAPLLRNILWDIRRFVGLAEQSDDLTMVGVKVLAT